MRQIVSSESVLTVYPRPNGGFVHEGERVAVGCIRRSAVDPVLVGGSPGDEVTIAEGEDSYTETVNAVAPSASNLDELLAPFGVQQFKEERSKG